MNYTYNPVIKLFISFIIENYIPLSLNKYIVCEFDQGVKRELPSLISTNTLPLSPLEILSSGSRYVVSNHDSALLFEMENLNGGWLDMVFATDEAVS